MNIPDEDLVRQLAERYGERRYGSHWAGGECRYGELYQEEPCPWCEAEQRRRDGLIELGSPPDDVS